MGSLAQAPRPAALRPARAGGCKRCPVLAASTVSDGSELFSQATGPNLRRTGVDIEVPRLDGAGKAPFPSPFCTHSACPLPGPSRVGARNSVNLHHAFVSDDDRVLLKSIAYGNPTSAGAEDCDVDCTFDPRWCIRAGPRRELYFNPHEVKAAVVTCGGLCPGLNDVIRQIVTTLESGYGVQDIVGIPYGYRGFFEPSLEARQRGGFLPIRLARP